MSTEKIFANGINFYQNENAPDFIIGDIEFNVEDAIVFLKQHMKPNGKCRVTVKVSKKGGLYCELNTWEPKKQEVTPEPQPAVGEAQDSFEDEDPADLPF